MAQTLADKLKQKISAKNITAYILFGAIIMVFVFFGMPNEMGGAGSVAKVNSTFISLVDYQQEEQRIQQYYNSLFGGGFDFSSQRQYLQQQALESLVRAEVVYQAAQKNGILATDAEVRDFIVKDIPGFQQNGLFQREFYMRYLESTRMSPGDFENKIRKEIINVRLRRVFEASSWPLTVEGKKEEELNSVKVNYLVARVEDASSANKVNVSAGEATEALAKEDFAKRVQQYFKSNRAEFNGEEEVKAQHILIKADPKDSQAMQAALKKAQDIKAQAASKDFGSLAAQYSDDPGSKEAKGDLGYFGRGRMVPAFETAAFSAKVGEITEPVQTDFGYHLIKVNDKKAATEAKFEDVKQQIAQKLLGQDRSNEITKTLEEALAKGDEAGVSAQLKNLGVTWEETGLMSLGEENWAKLQSPVAREAAFEASPSQPLVKRLVRDGAVKYVIKLKEVKKEAPTKTAQADQLQQKARGAGMFDAWTAQFRSRSDIEMNNEFFRAMK